MAAFPDGKHDNQVDALSYVAAYSGKVIHEARRWGLKLGRLRPPPVKVQVVPPNRATRCSTSGDSGVSGLRRSRPIVDHGKFLPVSAASPFASPACPQG